MTIQPDHWPDLLQAYLVLAAGRGAALPVRALRGRLGSRLDALLACGAAEPGPPLSIVTCPACFEGHAAEVDYDPVTRRLSVFCAKAGRIAVASDDLATVQPRLRWLPDQLLHLLDVRPSPPCRVLIEGVAWWLGDIVVGRTDVSITLAVGVRSTGEIQELIVKLQRHPPPGLALLLVAAGLVPAHVGNLTGYQPVLIEEIVRADTKELSVDRARLDAWVRAVMRGQARPKGGHGGRPSMANQVLSIFRARRQRGEPFINKSSEAKDIQREWVTYFPDQDPPAIPTIRAQLPTPVPQ